MKIALPVSACPIKLAYMIITLVIFIYVAWLIHKWAKKDGVI